MPKRTATKTRVSTTTKVALLAAAGVVAAAGIGYFAIRTPLGRNVGNGFSRMRSRIFSIWSQPPGYGTPGYGTPGYRPPGYTTPGYAPAPSANVSDGLHAGMRTTCTGNGWVIASRVQSIRSIAPGSVIKGPGAALYWYASDRKRYVFPNEQTYRTWFPTGKSCPTIHEVSASDLNQVSIGGNVTYKPLARFVKINTDPKVYAVGADRALHWIETEALARQIAGASWPKNVDDVPDGFFVNYSIEGSLKSYAAYRTIVRQTGTVTLDQNLGL